MKTVGRVWQIVGIAALTLVLARAPQAQAETYRLDFEYNGLHWSAESSARDVAEALIENVGDYSQLRIAPPPETPIDRAMTIIISDSEAYALDHAVSKNFQVQVAAIAEQEKAAEEAKVATESKPKPVPVAPKPAPKPPEEIYSGTATWYRHGDGLTTASRRWPRGTKIRVVAVNSGKTVDVVVNDYGPSPTTGVELDLNLPAFEVLAPAGAGKIEIKYFKL